MIFRTLLLTCTFSFLTGCFGPATFDASSDQRIKETTKQILETLPESDREEFQKALMYYAMGGETGIAAFLGSALTGNTSDDTKEALMAANISAIDGLTGEQILAKYRLDAEKLRIKQEQAKAKREQEQAEREQIAKLSEEAKELLNSNQFEAALEKYRRMSAYPSASDKAKAGIESTTSAMTAFAEKMNYIDQIEITEFLAQRIDTYSKKEIPAVRISVKNKGDRSLDKVKVTVYFQDKDGKTIFEEHFHPVLVSKYNFSGDNKPLKPGYVKEMEKDRFYTLESALSEWQEGDATAKVVDIEFTDSGHG
ncbi:MAG: hypothetical protein C9356_11725 [Oleiphilus sp.]|nr:MAG: hypothetical protein C9356_11725 [Oleiphilus sp.]